MNEILALNSIIYRIEKFTPIGHKSDKMTIAWQGKVSQSN